MLHFLWVIALILLLLWLLGFITNIAGGLVHILLVVALILLIIWLWQRVAHTHH